MKKYDDFFQQDLDNKARELEQLEQLDSRLNLTDEQRREARLSDNEKLSYGVKSDEEQVEDERLRRIRGSVDRASYYGNNPSYNNNYTTQRTKNPKWAMAVVLVVVLIAVYFLGFVSYQVFNPEAMLLNKVLQTAKDLYLEDVDTELLLMAAGKGMLAEIDQFSTFLSPQEYYALLNPPTNDGKILFGVSTQQTSLGYIVYDVTLGTDAYFTGLRRNDIILSIAGNDITSTTTFEKFQEYISLIETSDEIIVYRNDYEDADFSTVGVSGSGWKIATCQASIEKRNPKPAFVEYYFSDSNTNMSPAYIKHAKLNETDYTNKGIVYARITEFGSAGTSTVDYINGRLEFQYSAEKDFSAMMTKFSAVYPNKNGKLILDLRNNPGGFNQVCSDIAQYLIYDKNTTDKLTITSLRNDRTGYLEVTKATSKYADFFDVSSDDKKVVLLTTGMSASASEMLTGCTVDTYGYGTAVQVGTQTYGKGISQQAKTIKNVTIEVNGKQVQSAYAVYITFAKFYTPFKDFCNQNEKDKEGQYQRNGFKPLADNVANKLGDMLSISRDILTAV